MKGWYSWFIHRASRRGIILTSTGQHAFLKRGRVLFQNALGSTLQLCHWNPKHEKYNCVHMLLLISKNPCDMYTNSFKSEWSWESLLECEYLQDISDIQQSSLYVHITSRVTCLLFEKNQYESITLHIPRFLDFLLLFKVASTERRKSNTSTEVHRHFTKHTH